MLNALNISRKNEWWLWSELSSSPTFLSDVARKLVEVAPETKVKRYLTVTAWGTGSTKEEIPGWFRFFINNTKIGVTYLDHERQEEVWEKSGLDWTVVRPVGLTNDTTTKAGGSTFGNQNHQANQHDHQPPDGGPLHARCAGRRYLHPPKADYFLFLK